MLIIAYLFVALIEGSSCLHFYVKSDESRCFYENLSKYNLLVGRTDLYVESEYGEYIQDERLELSVSIYETFYKDERVFFQNNLPLHEFAFTAMDTGEHKICLKPIYPIKNARVRVFIDMNIGNLDVLDSKRMTDVSYFKKKLVHLIGKLEELRRDQAIINADEELFMNQSEEINASITNWSLIQLLVLTGVWLLQLYFLKHFFNKKKTNVLKRIPIRNFRFSKAIQ